ncbi:MAG: GNAT family N-acetyltransferase, partial [Clostridiales bacterium]
MIEAKNPFIKLKESIDRNDYEEIKNLQKICLEEDNIKLKLELDYKIARSELKTSSLNNINEFMYYDRNKLIGYIGVCDSQRDEIEISGMVSPEYRRNGVFKKLFSFVKDEWKKRNVSKILLLSDNKSFSGLEFIKSTGAMYGNSEYEMFLRNKPTKN